MTWVAKLKDGTVLREGQIDWDELPKSDIQVLYLVVGNQTLSLPRLPGGYFFQYHATSINVGGEIKKSSLYQKIGCTYNAKGDCIVVMATEDGDVLIGHDNVHDMQTFDVVGHINFGLQGIELACDH